MKKRIFLSFLLVFSQSQIFAIDVASTKQDLENIERGLKSFIGYVSLRSRSRSFDQFIEDANVLLFNALSQAKNAIAAFSGSRFDQIEISKWLSNAIEELHNIIGFFKSNTHPDNVIKTFENYENKLKLIKKQYDELQGLKEQEMHWGKPN